MKTTEQPSCMDTRQRLLHAAGEVFAEQGFRAATIRDICTKAGANVAAVNYHFRDKQTLYAEVLKYAYENARQKYPSGAADGAAPRERLAAFVRALVCRILDRDRLRWHGTLMFREMMEPTEALQTLIDQAIRPEYERLHRAIRDLLGPRASPEQVLQTVWSITGQCLFYYHARHVIARLRPGGEYGSEDIPRIVDHVIRFSLSAIQGMTGRKQDQNQGE